MRGLLAWLERTAPANRHWESWTEALRAATAPFGTAAGERTAFADGDRDSIKLLADEISDLRGELRRELEPHPVDHRAVLVAYLKSAVERCDWHAVSDAANDLRVLEASKR